MGFFKKLIGAIKDSATAIGEVTGGAYARYTVNKCKTQDGEDAIKFAMLSKPDIIITKADIREFTTLESGAQWESGSGSAKKRYVGNRYKIVTKEGQSAIINVFANYTSQVEALFLL